MKTFQQIGTDAGALVAEKNRAYGSSFSTAGAAMRLLYPDGISPDQMEDALVLVRIWDKLMRIATDRDALGESPYHDIIGYGILGVAMHQSTKGVTDTPCGSVSAEDAAKKSQAPSDSAAQPAPASTTPSASGSNGPSSTPPSRLQCETASAGPGAAPAPTAVDAAFDAASANHSARMLELPIKLNRARFLNSLNQCAMCGQLFHKPMLPLKAYFGTDIFFVHNVECGQQLLSFLRESA